MLLKLGRWGKEEPLNECPTHAAHTTLILHCHRLVVAVADCIHGVLSSTCAYQYQLYCERMHARFAEHMFNSLSQATLQQLGKKPFQSSGIYRQSFKACDISHMACMPAITIVAP